MQYRKFGNTGVNISALGFGCMRLPSIGEGDQKRCDDEKCIPIIRRAYADVYIHVPSAELEARLRGRQTDAGADRIRAVPGVDGGLDQPHPHAALLIIELGDQRVCGF